MLDHVVFNLKSWFGRQQKLSMKLSLLIPSLTANLVFEELLPPVEKYEIISSRRSCRMKVQKWNNSKCRWFEDPFYNIENQGLCSIVSQYSSNKNNALNIIRLFRINIYEWNMYELSLNSINMWPLVLVFLKHGDVGESERYLKKC